MIPNKFLCIRVKVSNSCPVHHIDFMAVHMGAEQHLFFFISEVERWKRYQVQMMNVPYEVLYERGYVSRDVQRF